MMEAPASIMSALRDVDIDDLLGRRQVRFDGRHIAQTLTDKTVMVTGAGGSIGSELCRQIVRCCPARMILVDINENSLFDLLAELDTANAPVLTPEIASIRDEARVEHLLACHRPQVVFHAAAHKHVPFMEAFPAEAIHNNVLGTRNLALTARRHACETFVLLSSDKAVNPAGVMGATKRLCEMLVLSLEGPTRFVSVRFGNVLGSQGSVVPLFKRQITAGGPITITHRDMTRYFMTIPEAAQLVLQAAAIAQRSGIFFVHSPVPQEADMLARVGRLALAAQSHSAEVIVRALAQAVPTYHPSWPNPPDHEMRFADKIS